MDKYVEFYGVEGDDPKRLGEAVLHDGKVTFSGLPARMVESFHETGIRAPGEEEVVYPKDGIKFLAKLSFAICGAYLWAEGVKER